MPALGSRKTQEMIMAAITVTEARFDDPAHAQGIIDVLDSYASDPVGGGTPLSPAVQERLLSMLRDHPTTVILLAMHGVHPVGVAICFVGLSTFQARPLLNIHDLAVIPEQRGQGIGRRLLRAAEREAARRGCCKLTLEVQDSNLRARRIYERFGFEDFVVGDSGPTRFLNKHLS